MSNSLDDRLNVRVLKDDRGLFYKIKDALFPHEKTGLVLGKLIREFAKKKKIK